MKRNEASERQIQAAHPGISTWLAANAGSGKTRVLTDRVARLLLEGTDPQKILCLTYTKAAAGEMQNRLFQRLGEWAMLNDSKLTQALAKLGEQDVITPERLRRARTLFARAIETPGGLKIQTIHSFCASLLRRFPLEAGVSPTFLEMSDRAANLLVNDILTDLAQGADRQVMDELCLYVSDQTLGVLVDDVISKRANFTPKIDKAAIFSLLGVDNDCTRDTVAQSVFLGGEGALFDRILPVLRQFSKTDNKAADILAGVTAFGWSDLTVLEGIFLFGANTKAPYCAKLEAFPTKACRIALGADLQGLQDLMQRVEIARQPRLCLLTTEKTLCLHRFAKIFLAELDRRKTARAWLDFDDLIQKARQLLNDPSVADWVLFRLDGGIDHILVDEAQDTSPDQWDVIEKLAREFTSGEGARTDTKRTLFVVGDKKQSIYSFQGADPDEFDRMQQEFGQRFRQAGSDLQDLTLEFSFRSSSAILSLVDLLFESKEPSGFTRGGQHRAFKSDLPGRVDMWPFVEETRVEDDRHWTDPVDLPGARHHTVVLAEQIADQIADMLARGETIPIEEPQQENLQRRAVQPGDFLILLQRRSDLFSEIIRACKSRNLPIAGADRLRVGAELAVKDLASLLKFLATPEDSLALAETLKSPLFGWDEQQLFDLAHRRTDLYLWQTLRERSEEFQSTLAILDDLRKQADFLRPYDLLERILTRHSGRKNLLARLGPEAEDGIDALLSQALAFEQTQVPSLTGFLVWMETDDLEIKRQNDNSSNLIRVMTVHGAKGLEAPIVILPDTAIRRPPAGSEIMAIDGLAFWRPSSDQMPDRLVTARDTRRARELRERDRLLYVAMTRAEKWLIIAGAGKVGASGESWYADVKETLELAGAVEHPMPGGTGLRLAHGDWDAPDLVVLPQTGPIPLELPAFLTTPVDRKSVCQKVFSPSDLGGAKALPGEEGADTEVAMARGRQIHALLEHLPLHDRSDWAKVVERLLPSDALPGVISEALAVLDSDNLEFLFNASTFFEVALTAEIKGNRILGVVDRLVVTPNRVLAVDFKSNAVVPKRPQDCPEGLLRQLGAYAAALTQIYPDRQIETAIVWTRMAEIMYIPHDLVTDALGSTAWVDEQRVAT